MAAVDGDICLFLPHIKQELPDCMEVANHLGGRSAMDFCAMPIDGSPMVPAFVRRNNNMANDTLIPQAAASSAISLKRVRPEPTEEDSGGCCSRSRRVKNELTDHDAVTHPAAAAAAAAAVAAAAAATHELGENASKLKQQLITDLLPAAKKKRDRFNGLTEEEVLKRTLPDHLALGLDILIVGINPGLTAAFVGHHYAGPGNHFWKCLYLSGLIPEPMSAYDDFKLLKYGIGFTNIVERTSKGSAELTKKEIKEGGEILKEKILKYQPKIVVFNGKGIYEIFAGHKNFHFGKQPEPFPDTRCTVYVVPSSSARCTQLPRAIDKVPFYVALRKLRDFVRGDVPTLEDSEVTFPDLELKTAPKKIKSEVVDDRSPCFAVAGPSADGAMTAVARACANTATGSAAKPNGRRTRKEVTTVKREPLAHPAPPVTLEPVGLGSHDNDLSALLQSYAAAAAAAATTQPGLLPSVKDEYAGRVGADRSGGNGSDLYGALGGGVIAAAAAHAAAAAAAAAAAVSAPQPSCSYSVVGHGSYPMTSYPMYAPYWSYMTMAAASGMAVPTSALPMQPRPALIGSAGSSPTASNVSSLTQASLESLPKADSKATVANWLQSIPSHVDPLVD